jgi:EAL domain-containing protein (putative c-di-GMP-specific phosphodiesterase class I)
MSTTQPPKPSHVKELLAGGGGDGGVGHVLRAIRKHLHMDVAFISRFRATDRILEAVDAEGDAPVFAGQCISLEEGYCLKVVCGELPQLIPDTALLPAALAIPATAAIPIGSHLSVPVYLESGEVYGTLCCFSYLPDRSLTERDLALLNALAEVLASQIYEQLMASRQREQLTDQIRAAIRSGAPRIVYQPIFDAGDERPVGVECLSRFDVDPRRGPDAWFAAAHHAGLGLELELCAIEHALAELYRFPRGMFLGINASPELLLSGQLSVLCERFDLSRIVIEVTEHAMVGDYVALTRVLAPLREQGARLAIDDAGAGYASMSHILQLRADMIKLDMSLTRGIDTDRDRRALAKGLISFAHEIGAHITAEGVETYSELEALRRVQVDKVQGHYLSRPLSLQEALVVARGVNRGGVLESAG